VVHGFPCERRLDAVSSTVRSIAASMQRTAVNVCSNVKGARAMPKNSRAWAAYPERLPEDEC
jgi:hypothetical protein